jgi:hypothetical protein
MSRTLPAVPIQTPSSRQTITSLLRMQGSTPTNGFTLVTPGAQTISGSLFDASGINGTANVMVSP